MKIVIQTIPHGQQRYNTVGDYWTDPDGTKQIRISELPYRGWEFLVALHEMIEQELCTLHNIPDEAIDKFDFNYTGDEPGDNTSAPYWIEHQAASAIERTMAAFMEVDWVGYGKAVDLLCKD